MSLPQKKNHRKKNKKPWPTKAAMAQIYEMKLWGGNQTDFYSGAGSHDPKLVQPYIEVVSTFLQSFATPLIVCDLGCGDFNIGKQLAPYAKTYIGVDIVDALIARNQQEFKLDHLEFQCLDISVDDLPKADCVILRQVLQHLSNLEIQRIVAQLQHYKYIIVTEHIPSGSFTPNLDIISGQGIRLKKQSGVQLSVAPFHLKATHTQLLLRVPSNDGQGVIETQCLTLF